MIQEIGSEKCPLHGEQDGNAHFRPGYKYIRGERALQRGPQSYSTPEYRFFSLKGTPPPSVYTSIRQLRNNLAPKEDGNGDLQIAALGCIRLQNVDEQGCSSPSF